MTIEWLNAELTRARVTVEAADSRWWRRRYVTAEVVRVEPVQEPGRPCRFRSYADWQFVVGGDRVCDHNDSLAHQIDEVQASELYWREKAAKRAALKNPWSETP